MHTRYILLAATLCVACGDNAAGEQCDVGISRQAVQAEDRYLLGRGGAYPADAMLRGQERALYRSQSLRREAAWRTVAKALAPVAVAVDLPNSELAEIPLWQTWYAKDDTTRIFQYLYEALDGGERLSRERFEQTDIDEALGWNATELDELGNWPLERREAYQDAVDTPEQFAGLGGIGVVGYSPSALRTLLRSYPEMLACLESGIPDSFVDTPGQTVGQIVREPLTLSACETRRMGPFYLGEDEELSASISGDGSRKALTRVSRLSTGESTECEGNGPCSLVGRGAVYVDITAGIVPIDGVVKVEYASPDAPWAGCLEGAFATDSVVVKASWHRAQFGAQLPVYDTSALALETTLAGNASAGWGTPSREADPDSSDIYTIERPNGNRYRLAGLHIMSKELEHWQWITLWWSDAPDMDFGEDRPDSIRDLGSPWQNYKMCTVTMFDEGDSDPSGGFAQSAPSLAAALESVHAGAGAPSWCSNPYIEEGDGNMGTNCIGCHQHGGTNFTSEEIISDPQSFPEFGRVQLRNNFPHDYSWAPAAGDQLTLAFKAIVDFFE